MFVLQRTLHSVHRFEPFVSPRDPPPPSLPGGSSHALSANEYYARDGRRFSTPPKLVYDPKALPSGNKSSQQPPSTSSSGLKTPKPGFGFNWKTGSNLY